MGVFWYFFMEVFDRFIPYFLFVLHIHPCIYVYPLLLRLKCVSHQHPFLFLLSVWD